MYILYNINSRGYFTRSSTYSSNWQDAKQLPRDEAIALAKRHKNHAGYGMILVRLEDMEALV